MMISMRHILKPVVLVLFSLVIFASGCAREESLLENPGFKASDKGIKGWSVEGEGSLEKAEGGGAIFAALNGAPFVYQQADAKKRHKGASLSLGAWVRTDMPDTVFIEFSNRLGIDAMSETHPGDGKWHLMTVTARVPDASRLLEFRLRLSRPGVAYIKDASMSPGTAVTAEGGGPGIDAPFFMALLAEGASLALLLGLVVRFRRHSDTVENRIFEVFVILSFLSAMVLILGKSANASVVANLAWAAGCAGGLLFIMRSLERPVLTRLPGPGVLISAAALMSLVMAIVSLRDGSVATAEKSALLAYLLFISSLAAIPAYRLYRRSVEAGSRQRKVRIYKTPGAPDGNPYNEPDGVSSDEAGQAGFQGQGPINE